MARIYSPRYTYQPMALGAVGGLASAAVALVFLVAHAAVGGRSMAVGPNALGAWFVRWLQTASPTAFGGFYWDATVGGIVVVLLGGAAIGAVFSQLLSRLPSDQPLVWGAVLGLVIWALGRWALAPALDPVLLRVLSKGEQLATALAFGLLLGAWVLAGRSVRIAGAP